MFTPKRIIHIICIYFLIQTSSVLQAESFYQRFEAIWEAANPKQRYQFLYDLPKGGDLHNHFPGTSIPEWILAVLQNPERTGGDTFWTRMRFASPLDAIAPDARCHTIRNHTYQKLPPAVQAEYVRIDQLTDAEEIEWCNAFRLDAEGEGRDEFFGVIWTRFGDIFENVHFRLELLEDNIKAFAAEGLRYWEPQFGPQDLTTNEGEPISIEDGVAMIRERLAKPEIVETGMVSRFQKTIFRYAPYAEEMTRELYEFVDAYRDLWVGLNMAGIEEKGKGYPARFLETLRELRSEYPGLPLAFHAGEMDSPDRNVRDTLLLGATRIGHGLNILGDPDTLLLLQMSDRVLIETNLISNQLLEYVSDLEDHPFPEILRTGIPTCLNTDDRGMWDTNMTDEYYAAMKYYNLSWPELTLLGRYSLQYAFVEEPVKSELLEDYENRLSAFKARYSKGTVEDALKTIDAVPAVTYGYALRNWGISFD
ncbi:MAG: adenosine deaminase [Verrucomicrobiota bacterium]